MHNWYYKLATMTTTFSGITIRKNYRIGVETVSIINGCTEWREHWMRVSFVAVRGYLLIEFYYIQMHLHTERRIHFLIDIYIHLETLFLVPEIYQDCNYTIFKKQIEIYFFIIFIIYAAKIRWVSVRRADQRRRCIYIYIHRVKIRILTIPVSSVQLLVALSIIRELSLLAINFATARKYRPYDYWLNNNMMHSCLFNIRCAPYLENKRQVFLELIIALFVITIWAELPAPSASSKHCRLVE